MVSIDFDQEQFERRLQSLKDSQESIQSLSAWCLERRQHHKKIVSMWLQVLKKVKVEHRLTLFYLANDVIQYSKRKNFEFVESWGTTLQRATTMVRDEKVKHRILRIFKIWDQRQVYDEEFLADLSGLISAAPKKKMDPQPIQQPEEFQAALLISTMRSCATLEQATDARLRDLREANVDINNAEELCASLKDRRRVEDAEKEVDQAARNIENYVRALEAEIRERKQVLDLLEQADQFYETQRGEVKIVVNAYRNFGSRVKNLKKKLDELLPMLASPIPSPDINAPSPSPDSDIELPGEESLMDQSLIDVLPPSMYGSYGQDYNPLTAPMNNTTADFTNNFSSFIGGNLDFDPRSIFADKCVISVDSQQYNLLENESNELIDTNSTATEPKNDEPSLSFLKTVLPSSEPVSEPCGIPGLGLDDTVYISAGSAPMNDLIPTSHERSLSTPMTGRVVSIPTTSQGALSHAHLGHSTPLQARDLNGESHSPSPYSSENSQNNATDPSTSFEGSTSAINPLQPPPMPPIEFLDDNNCYNKLPPKFPTWTFANDTLTEIPKWDEKVVFPVHNDTNPIWPVSGDKIKRSWNESSNEQWDMSNNEPAWTENLLKDALSETPESPPLYEKAGFTAPVEYNDSHSQDPILSSVGDVDHRILPVSLSSGKQMHQHLVKSVDVDHRNLISLTGSPANNSDDAIPGQVSNLWTTYDQDYRKPNLSDGDNVESVDMEMSDEESENKKNSRMHTDSRSYDRDMRVPNMPPVLPVNVQYSDTRDMDMRLMLSSSTSMDTMSLQRRDNLRHGLRGIDTKAPPPPPPPLPFHGVQQKFSRDQSDFRPDRSLDTRPNEFFLSNQQEFRPTRKYPPSDNIIHQDFHSGPQDFDSFENQHGTKPPMHRGDNIGCSNASCGDTGSNDLLGNPGIGFGGNPGTGFGSDMGGSIRPGGRGGGMFHSSGGARPPWISRGGRGPRLMVISGFPQSSPSLRGMKHRGSPYRGAPGYRGRGRVGRNVW